MVITHNLQEDARIAQRKKVPLLVVFSQEHCEFCVVLAEEIIEPMLISGDYTNRVLIREIMIDDPRDVIDFDGRSVTAYSLFNHYDMFVTPTILLLDHQGKEVAERMTGINTVEYYGYYLDQSIDKALMQIRQKSGKYAG